MVQMVLKRSLLTFLLSGAILLFGSCSLLEPGLSVLRGNYLYQQGRYQNALLLYLEGDESGKSRERILYNIGNVYYALGEGPPPLKYGPARRIAVMPKSPSTGCSIPGSYIISWAVIRCLQGLPYCSGA